MTSGEAARATANQSRIDQQVHNDRSADGGALTQQQRQQVNREQNAASRQIYNENHNGNTVRQMPWTIVKQISSSVQQTGFGPGR